MAQFLFVYHGGSTMPTDPAEIEQIMAAWGAWFGELGDAVVNPGNPVGASQTVDADGVTGNGGSNPASGFSITKADDLDAALAAAANCPMISVGKGSVEVAPIVEL
jgi:hypothetical protein